MARLHDRQNKLTITDYLRFGKNAVIKVADPTSNTEAEINLYELKNLLDGTNHVEDLTAASTLTANDSGKTFFLNSATEFATTLPSPAAGLRFKFIVKAAPSGANYTIVTASSANIIIGGINELEVDTGDDGPYDNNGDTITFVQAVSVVGDWVEMVSDGTSWYVTGQANADGGITITGS